MTTPEPEVLTLRSVLESLGVDAAEIAQAEEDGTVAFLAVDRLVLPTEPHLTLADVAAQSGIDELRLRSMWRALGFADPGVRAALDDGDLAMVEALATLMDGGSMEPEIAVQMARVIGSSMARVAAAQVGAFGDRLADIGAPDPDAPLAVDAGAWLPIVPEVLERVWRRHVRDAARRRVARADSGGTADVGRSIGFADLVGFTALSQQLDDQELAEVVHRFEVLAYDTVGALGGQVVKMIGDEVMFTTDDVASAAEIGLSLADTYRDDANLSDVRVGISVGRVVERGGDFYGPAVNLASRLTAIAYPGSVIVATDVHEALVDADNFVFSPMRPRRLKNLGRVDLWRLRWGGEDVDPQERARREQARDRRETIRRLVEKRVVDELEQAAEDDPELRRWLRRRGDHPRG